MKKPQFTDCFLAKKRKLSKEWHQTKNGELTPKDIIAGSARKTWWICFYGHEWQTAIKYRLKGTGCPHCYNKLRKEGFYSESRTTDLCGARR